MMSEFGMRPSMLQNGEYGDESMGKDIGLMMRGEQRMRYQEVGGGGGDREMDMNLFRSGSAPPTVEDSLSSVGGLFSDGSLFSKYGGGERKFASEEELRSDPGYVKFYYANVNLNPRLPPPLVTKEDWRIAQRLKNGASGGCGMARTTAAGNTSLFSDQLSFNGKREDKLPGLGLGNREKSLAEIFQDDYSQARPLSRQASRPVSCNAFEGNVESSESQFAQLHHKLAFFDPSLSSENIKGISSIGASASQTYASALGASLSRSTTPDPQGVARSPSPCIPSVGEGRLISMEKRSINYPIPYNGVSSGKLDSTNLLTTFSGMNLSTNGNINEVNHLSRIEHEIHDQPRLFNMQHNQILNKEHSYLNNPEYLHHIPEPVKGMHPSMGKISGIRMDELNSSFMADGSVELRKPAFLANSYLKGSPTSHNQNVKPLINHGLNGYAINPGSPSMINSQISSGNFPSSFEKAAAASAMGVSGMNSRTLGGGLAAATEFHNLSRTGNQVAGNAVDMSRVDPLYLHYLKSTEYAASQAAALKQSIRNRECMADSQTDLLGFQKAYLGALLASQRSQYGVPYLGKASNNGCYRNQEFGFGMQFPGSPLAGNFHHSSAIGPGSPVTHGDWNPRFLSGMRDFTGNVMGAWHDNNFDENIALSLVEEFKSNKTKCFELSEIAGHVVEFSSDQYGSRFIQQKLETATMEEKNMIFSEIMPQAFTLMTDVFGNYVIQKFFEHGTPAQIRELGMQLHGNVLTLSLQMYGCRVIQKAIEVVDLDQQTKMVSELDGNIMRCVRDQNGNHVIQKCIECIPEDVTHFIVSTFYDQVVTLSTHPYGCRVIQRVLEHCHDPKTQRIMMDEIMHCVCMLAQDQYGNYVVQHVLEHGKPHERSNIIKQLTGQIVQMSQQKFASNVVEKCLTFGDIVERQTLVTEMLGSTDENEPLQAMMKDQFANYVVQKVMETCDEQQLDLILNRIKVHLTALKKYTYGKHIVARVEKLVAAGERRISIQNMNSA